MSTIVLGLRIVLAVVFVAAGVGKLLDLAGSRRAMQEFGVPERAAGVAGILLPIAELATGIALIFRPAARWGAVAALALLGAFIVGIARAMARGEEPDCHCFGQIHSAPAGRITLARNAVLAAFAIVVVSYGSGPAVDTWVTARSAAELVAVGAVICAAAAAGYVLALRSRVERLKGDLGIARQAAAAGRHGLPVGFDAPEFTLPRLQGEMVTLTSLRERGQPVLLLFMSPYCGPCARILPRVQQWQQTLSTRMTIAVLSMGTAEENAVYDEHGMEDVLLQENMEVASLYGAGATPSAVFVSPDGRVASNVAESEYAIEPLVRLALRNDARAPMNGSVA